ncbi:HlyD family secretion protein [Methanofollis tationis]|uniref:Uncharacterized protein n=1 Tax=Methanofollis tationis TaxID=81417 RepID=A0A7K4HRL5_9EURY|nr:hypothetical protein [Methanofollis tationis]NVO67896.1 hypothetical protein [Methanofollis tationis]
MRSAIKVLMGLLAVFCLVQAASAAVNYKLSTTPTVSPSSGDISPGEPVTVLVTLTLTGTEQTFPDKNQLEFYTELNDPQWTRDIQIDGIGSDSPRTVKNMRMTIPGFELSYKSGLNLVVKVTLKGYAPTVTATSSKTIMSIQELDSNGVAVEGSTYSIKRTVVNPQDVQANIATAQTRLTALKASIDEKLVSGVDTTAAQTKYDEAKAAINRASSTSDFAAAKADLTVAQTAMDAAETALVQAEAQKEINDAQSAINQIDGIITYFEVNRSMGTDQRVMNLKTQRDLAAQSLSLANDQMNAKNYDAARIKGADANQKAQSTLTLATQVREEIGEGFSLNLGSLPLYIGAGIVIVLIIGGIIYLRNRKRWDELG